MAFDIEDLARRLERWARAQGLPAQVAGLRPMPGNAGLSFGFDLLDGGEAARSLVIRLAPPGVRRSGNTDVLRQVPLLGALAEEGIPIAPLVWSTGEERWFGTDVLVQERLSAKPLHMHDPPSGVQPQDGDTGPYLRRAVNTLAAVRGPRVLPVRDDRGLQRAAAPHRAAGRRVVRVDGQLGPGVVRPRLRADAVLTCVRSGDAIIGPAATGNEEDR